MSVDYKDYYQVLGVERLASKEEIAKAYKKLAKKHHPDLNPGDKVAEERFKDITEAYEVLKDDEKRRLYDQLGSNWQHGQQFQNAGPGAENFNFTFNGQGFQGSGFSDFFEALFGEQRRARAGNSGGFGPDPFGGFSSRQQRGRDVEADLDISLLDAVRGGERQLTLQGGADGGRTLKVSVPAGVRDGAKLRLAGQGQTSPVGGPKGDLYLKIRYAPDPRFSVEGDNLLHEASILPWEAALGGTVRVPTLEGEVELKVPAGTGSGRKLRLRGKGLGEPGQRGDLFVRLAITVPAPASDSEREHWEALASAYAARV